MADFSLTTLFVVPDGNTLPTTGSTENVAPGQFGFFKNDYKPATAANVAAAPYIYLVQGRQNKELLTSKRSDKLTKSRIIDFYKIEGHDAVTHQVTEVSDVRVGCGTQITFTFRLFSNYIDIAFYNGLTRSVTVNTECCPCGGGEPCDIVDSEKVIDDVIAAAGKDEYITKFLTLEKNGAGAAAKLVVTGKPLDKYGRVSDDLDTNPYEYDILRFNVFVVKATDTTADFFTWDRCDLVAKVTPVSKASFVTGTSEEIRILQERYYSYQAHMKHLFRQSGWNVMYEDYVKPGIIYDTYYIKFKPIEAEPGADALIIIAVPQGKAAAIESILTAAIGAPVNKS